MSENCSVQQLVEDLRTGLTTLEACRTSEKVVLNLLDIYRRFMIAVHRDLASSGDQGPALATAVCIPLWEMLHFYSGPLGPFSSSPRAFVITLLTSLYPKSKDRRCLYQQLGCMCSLGHSSVPLSSSLPMSTELVRYASGVGVEQDNYDDVVGFVRNTVSAEKSITQCCSLSALNAKLRLLMEDVLPRCCVVVGESDGAGRSSSWENAIIITMGENEKFPPRSLRVLKETLWKYLVLLHVYSSEEARSLGNYLTSSPWSQRTVCVSAESEVTYSSLIGSVVHEVAVCASLASPNTNMAPDNSAFICPHLLEELLSRGCQKDEPLAKLGVLTSPFDPNKAMRRETTVYEGVAVSLHETLFESVPQELSFCGSSSSCRDCDKLTLLCRSAMLSAVVRGSGAVGLPSSVARRILFDRKRGRDDVYEGPVLLPFSSGLSDLLDRREGATIYSTLERITTACYSA